METHEQATAATEQPVAEEPTPAAEPGAKSSAAARQFQEVVSRLGQLTISLMQQSEELEEKERQHEALGAEITQRRLRIEAEEREQLRTQGAVGALQALVQGEGQQQGGGDAN